MLLHGRFNYRFLIHQVIGRCLLFLSINLIAFHSELAKDLLSRVPGRLFINIFRYFLLSREAHYKKSKLSHRLVPFQHWSCWSYMVAFLSILKSFSASALSNSRHCHQASPRQMTEHPHFPMQWSFTIRTLDTS
jgi:hypothetical protein